MLLFGRGAGPGAPGALDDLAHAATAGAVAASARVRLGAGSAWRVGQGGSLIFNSRPIYLTLTPGLQHERTQAAQLLERPQLSGVAALGMCLALAQLGTPPSVLI